MKAYHDSNPTPSPPTPPPLPRPLPTWRRLGAVAVVSCLALLISPSLTVAQEPPGANTPPPREPVRSWRDAALNGAELQILHHLAHRQYRVRYQAIVALRALPEPRAAVVLARGLIGTDGRVRRICAQEVALREQPLPELAPILIEMLRDEVVQPDGAAFLAVRDALLRIGPAADAAFQRAVRNGLLDEAPELESLGRQIRLQAVVRVLDEIPLPDGTAMFLPFAGQFRSATQPEWAPMLHEIMRAGAPELGALDADGLARRRALACFALGEWAAQQPRQTREWALDRVKAEWASVNRMRARTRWMQTPAELLSFALDAVAYALGDATSLDAAVRDIDHRLAVFEQAFDTRDAGNRRVPAVVFYLTTNKAFLVQAMGQITLARQLWRTALHEMEFESGVSRQDLAHAHVLYARTLVPRNRSALANNNLDTADEPSAVTAAFEAIDRAITLGFRDARWLRVNPEFSRLHDDAPRFGALMQRMDEPLPGDPND